MTLQNLVDYATQNGGDNLQKRIVIKVWVDNDSYYGGGYYKELYIDDISFEDENAIINAG